MNGDLVVLAEERMPRDGLGQPPPACRRLPAAGSSSAADFRTSVPGIWAIGDAAAFDGVRLGLLVSPRRRLPAPAPRS